MQHPVTNRNFKIYLLQFLKGFLYFIGIFSLVLFILSFTDLPYYAYYKLSLPEIKLKEDPTVIVVLGGAGMPSPDGLIRTYYAAKSAQRYKNATIIIALPNTTGDSFSQINLMAHELIIRNVDSARIRFEPEGFNTRSQALNVAKMYSGKMDELNMLLVTSPEHVYRAVKAFKKAGFTNVAGNAAFERPIDEDKIKDKENTNDTRIKSLSLRYNMWS